ncbi:predicted protein [Nematostella vectensis]|uniref:Protein ecdysoneless homolog n=1 Tax=Nematostella vectensis TaxID=45351 RepID=A7SE99_NEMVE|nr:predicted protein [Nematostella vectensis]|eukprot:XP_001630061.1 predicted protein [Nematostella vectensis]
MDDSTVEYRVYIRDILTSGTGQLETVLESRLVEYLAFFSPLIGDYIWQNQAFNLTSVKSESPPCLMGRVDFGDSVDDEWFIVYLLTQLSIKYSDVCVSVHDSDGEFLLIEAAHVIPKWLKPESSKNRVFIQGGNVHIIPLPSSPGEITIFPTGWPTLIISLQLVFGPHETAAAQEIQQAIKQRLDRFPDAVQEMFHHANLYVPPGVKYLLEKNLALVSQAVNAFYHRDPRDMKACRQMKYFPPDQTVRTRVRFTKCLYAQLAQRQFLPDRASSWKLPPASHPHHGNHALGYKLLGAVMRCNIGYGVMINYWSSMLDAVMRCNIDYGMMINYWTSMLDADMRCDIAYGVMCTNTCGFEILCSKASSDCKQRIAAKGLLL